MGILPTQIVRVWRHETLVDWYYPTCTGNELEKRMAESRDYRDARHATHATRHPLDESLDIGPATHRVTFDGYDAARDGTLKGATR